MPSSLLSVSTAVALSVASLAVAGCSSGSTHGGADASRDAGEGGGDAKGHPGDTGGAEGGLRDGDGPRDGRGDGDTTGDARHPDGALLRDGGPGDGPRDGHEGEGGAHDGADPRDGHAGDGGHDSGFDAGPPALRVVGRALTDGTSPDGNGTCTAATPCIEWSGTQILARFTGATDYHLTMSDYGNYFDVYVDGVLQATPIVGSTGTPTDVAIATGLSASATHEVSLYKRTEASTNGRTMVSAPAFPNGGTLLPPAAPAARRIEVVGDSISCGYGVLGPDATCTETPAYEDHDDSYGAITARALDADLYTIASSGRGMYQNVDCTTTGTLPDIYGDTLPYVTDGTPSSWDFASWVPDVVVIDLGTNDFFCSEGGGAAPGTNFQSAYLAFVQRVRQNYPSAWIYCTNGPMLIDPDYTTAATYIQGVVTMLADPKVAFLAFPTQTQNAADQGCDGHPDPTTQAAMATQLTAALQMSLGW